MQTEQFSRRLDPVTNLTGRLGFHSTAALVMDAVSILVGILILIFRNRAGGELMRLCGVAMFIAAATDLWLSVRAYWLKRRERRGGEGENHPE